MKKLKYLLLILPFLFISNVKGGSISEARLFGHNLDGVWQIAPNNSLSSTADYFLFTDGSVPNYLYADVCTTGNPPSVWITGFGGNTRVSPDTKVYKVNKPCFVSGYEASIYRFTFYVTSFDDAGNGNLGLQFNTRLFSNTNYNTFFRLLSITYSDSLSYSDIDLSNQENIIEQNNQIITGQQDIKDSVNKVDGTLKDDNVNISESSITDNSASVSDSPISDLLILPIKLLNNISNGIQGTCTTFNLGNLFGTDIILPCINLESILGSFLWGLIDSLFCIFLIYNVCMLAIKIWTDVIMMEDVFRDLYKPSSEKKGGGKK